MSQPFDLLRWPGRDRIITSLRLRTRSEEIISAHEVILTALKSIINIFNVFELQVRPVEIAALMSRVCHGASALHLHTPLFKVATLTKYILVLLYVCMCVCVYVCVGGV